MAAELHLGRAPHPWADWLKKKTNPEVTTILGETVRVPSLSTARGAWGERRRTDNCQTCPHHVPQEEVVRVKGFLPLKARPNAHDGICLYGKDQHGAIIPKRIDPGDEFRNKHCVSGDDNRKSRAQERRDSGVLY